MMNVKEYVYMLIIAKLTLHSDNATWIFSIVEVNGI